jgi:hypothetical protein
MLLFHFVISHTVFVKSIHPFDVEKLLDIYALECLQQYCYYDVGKVALHVCGPMDRDILQYQIICEHDHEGKEVGVAYKKALSQYLPKRDYGKLP